MIPSLAVKAAVVLVSAGLGYVTGELLVKNGLIAAAVGGIVAVMIEALKTVVALRKQRVSEFTVIERRSDEVHAQAEKFYEAQIEYYQAQERTTRQRLHAIMGEIQRGVLHIRNLEDLLHEKGIEAPRFDVRSVDEIIARYPLPEAPRTDRS